MGALEYWFFKCITPLLHHSITLQSLLCDMAPSMIRAAHQRTGLDVAEAELLGFGFEFFKLVRRHVTLDTKLAIRRLEILSDGNNVDVVFSQIMQCAHRFIVGFPNANHKARLGQHVGAHSLGFS
jgi:hypothetical protein